MQKDDFIFSTPFEGIGRHYTTPRNVPETYIYNILSFTITASDGDPRIGSTLSSLSKTIYVTKRWINNPLTVSSGSLNFHRVKDKAVYVPSVCAAERFSGHLFIIGISPNLNLSWHTTFEHTLKISAFCKYTSLFFHVITIVISGHHTQCAANP